MPDGLKRLATLVGGRLHARSVESPHVVFEMDELVRYIIFGELVFDRARELEDGAQPGDPAHRRPEGLLPRFGVYFRVSRLLSNVLRRRTCWPDQGILNMPEPGLAFQMVAVMAGALGGALVGIAGGVGGTLARRGERRRWIDAVLLGVAALGMLAAVVGLVGGGLQQPPSVWLGLVLVGTGLIYLAWRINRHLGVLRAQAPGSKILVPGEADKIL